MSINSVVLTGRLTADPEIKFTPSGTQIAQFRLAVDRMKKGEADFLPIVAFEKTAELVGQYLGKGSLVGVEGRAQSRSWEGNDGKKRSAVEFVAMRVSFLETKAEAEKRKAEDSGGAPAGDDGGEEGGTAGDGGSDQEDPFG